MKNNWQISTAEAQQCEHARALAFCSVSFRTVTLQQHRERMSATMTLNGSNMQDRSNGLPDTRMALSGNHHKGAERFDITDLMTAAKHDSAPTVAQGRK